MKSRVLGSLVVSSVAIALNGCASKKTSDVKVIGGTVDSPYYSSIAKSTVEVVGYNEHCSGVLINSRQVLTAAHCIKVSEPYHNISFNNETFITVPTSSIQVHEGFRTATLKTPANDIAILTFPRGETAPASFRPAKLIERGGTLPSGIIAAGFGETRSRFGGLQLTPLITSRTMLPENASVRLLHRTSGLCVGDSGGPSFGVTPSGLILVGINIRGNCGDVPNPDPNVDPSLKYTSVFLDLRLYRQWIDSRLSD